MDERTIGRRGMLRGAGVAAGGAVVGGLALSTPVHADNDRSHRSGVEGSWMVTRFDPADGVERTFVFNLARGGVNKALAELQQKSRNIDALSPLSATSPSSNRAAAAAAAARSHPAMPAR